MNKFLKYLFIIFFFYTLYSCGDEIPDGGGGAVNFRLELGNTGRDAVLRNISSYKEFTTPRSANEKVGKSGLLVINIGIKDDGLFDLKAYDLCCPFENRIDTKINLIGLKGVCPKCKSEFDVTGIGDRTSGPATRGLFFYRIRAEGTSGDYRVSNY